MLANGSLLVHDVGAEDKGNYLCQASNGVGADLSKVAFLTVHGEYIVDSVYCCTTNSVVYTRLQMK